MRHHLSDFTVHPSVFPSDAVSRVTIRSRGRNTAFEQGYTYRVVVTPMEALCASYDRLATTSYLLQPEDGALTFEHEFRGEQAHVIVISPPEELTLTPCPYFDYKVPRHPSLRTPCLYVYSVRSDLYGCPVHKGDLHLHTFDSDGHEDAAGVVSNLRTAGYDFLAITNHHVFEPSEEAIALFDGVASGMTLLTGEEVHVPTDRIHAINVGATQSVNGYYRAHREEADQEVRALAQTLELPEDVEPVDYAYRVWAARKIREFGGMAIFAHPHWMWQHGFFVADPITKLTLARDDYDAFELLDGGLVENNMTTALYQEERAAGHTLPPIGSSDSHCTENGDPFRPTSRFTLVFSPGRDWESLRDAICRNQCVAVEQHGSEPYPRAYGAYRLVKYALFLLHNYYPVYQELCFEQGRQLREYALTGSDESARLLRLFDERADAFTRAFFGGIEPR